MLRDDILFAVDRYLEDCIRRTLHGETLPEWPLGSEEAMTLYGLSSADAAAFAAALPGRVDFHGVGLVLVSHPGKMTDWPTAAADEVREAARHQSFWELGHREVAARLIDTLASAGAEVTATKGTALAYSVYATPAERRRGDSDFLVANLSRSQVRSILKASGFQAQNDARPFQETWSAECKLGFLHFFDLHWRINSSGAVAHRLEQGGIGSRSIPLPRLSQSARAIAPVDNLILIAVNRALHRNYGYQSGTDKAFEQERLIWAIDVALLTRYFGDADWAQLLTTVRESGTAPLVSAILEFSKTAAGTPVPDAVFEALAKLPGDARLLACTEALPRFVRTRLDLAASPALADKLRVVGHALVPSRGSLHERYPPLAHWPAPLLHARRMSGVISELLLGRS